MRLMPSKDSRKPLDLIPNLFLTMKIFYTNAAAKIEIAELESKITDLTTASATATADIDRLTAELKTATDALAALQTEHGESITALDTAEQALNKANADLSAANDKLATFDASVETAAQAKFASLGGSPIGANNSGTSDSTDKPTMKREAFSALTPQEKMAFVKSTGKITE